MHVAPTIFKREFSRFKMLVRQESGRDFASFQEGLPAEWEAYKEEVRNEALRRLNMASWESADVGSGKILKRVIEAIEINENAKTLRNNIVAWQNRYGHNGRSHNKLLDAQAHDQARQKFEQWFLDFSQNAGSEEELFERFVKLIGKRYDLLAYLFFLKDWTRFMPIAPTTFDKVFRRLEIPLITSGRCSWDNYQQYNDALEGVQRALREYGGVDARLIDAHSFCWIRERLEPMPPAISDDQTKR